jgi:phosphopantetheine adenylyltransferase
VQIVQLAEPFGPTVTEADIELMVCSAEPSVQKGVQLINEKRSALDMAPLAVVTIRLLCPASGFG